MRLRRRQTPPDPDGYREAIRALQEELLATWTWDQIDSGGWVAATARPRRLGLWLSVPDRGVIAHAILFEPKVPSHAHAETVLFCVAANRFFSGCNLYLEPNGEVISVCTFHHARESDGILRSEMILAMVLPAIRRAVAVAPAIQAVIDGVPARQAIVIADKVDDMIELEDILSIDREGENAP